MGDFFRSGRFKALLVLFALLFAFLLRSIYVGGLMPLTSGLAGLVMTPVSRVTAKVSAAVSEFFSPYLHAADIDRENERLRAEVIELTEQLVDYQTVKNENEQFRELLEIKERNEDFDFEPAMIVGRTPDDRFGSFVIDVGEYHGITPRDPVITPAGLIGIVSEVSYSYSKVLTIIDPSVDIGSMDIRTLDTGIVGGTVTLAEHGLCRLSCLARESGAAPGDTVITSGIGGLLPKGLVVGSIDSVLTESTGLSLYAVIEPAADISGAKSVFVITQFAGKDQAVSFLD